MGSLNHHEGRTGTPSPLSRVTQYLSIAAVIAAASACSGKDEPVVERVAKVRIATAALDIPDAGNDAEMEDASAKATNVEAPTPEKPEEPKPSKVLAQKNSNPSKKPDAKTGNSEVVNPWADEKEKPTSSAAAKKALDDTRRKTNEILDLNDRPAISPTQKKPPTVEDPF